MENRIKVGIRVRPLSSKEQNENSANAVLCDEQRGSIAVGGKKPLGYDWVYGSGAQQRAVYEQMCLPLIDKCFEGYNATFFAYGQTGAGKTYTMGTTSDFSSGIVPFAVRDIIAKKQAMLQSSSVQCSIDLSFVEIYLEDCFDLLHPDGEKKKLDLRESSHGETYLEGLTSLPIHSMQDVAQCISAASKIRSTGKTAMNAASSRSHALCMLTIRVVKENSSFVSKLNLVDLAGSERARKTLATGEAFQEGVNINRGLFALGKVVQALQMRSNANANTNTNENTKNNSASNSSVAPSAHIHVPYRESKLTRLLKDSLGGNGMTVLLACVSPAQSNVDETLNTLRFASRASSIVNSAKVNVEEQSDASSLLKEVNRLREQLVSLQSKYDDLQNEKALYTHSAADKELMLQIHEQTKGFFMDMQEEAASQGQKKVARKRKSHESENETDRDRLSLLTTSSSDIESDAAMSYLLSSHKLCTALRSLLTQIFEGDLAVGEEEIISLQRELSHVRHCLGLGDSEHDGGREGELFVEGCSVLFDTLPGGGGEDMAALLRDLQSTTSLPPIIATMEGLKELERHFLKRLNVQKDEDGDDERETNKQAKKRRISFADDVHAGVNEREQENSRRHSEISTISQSSSNATESPFAPMMHEVRSPDLSGISLSPEEMKQANKDREARLSGVSLFSLSLDDELRELEVMEKENDDENPAPRENEPFKATKSEKDLHERDNKNVKVVSREEEIERATQRELLRAQTNLAAKERRMHSMATLSLKYQTMIESLHSEIAQLEQETSSLAVQEAAEIEKERARERETAQNDENVNTLNIAASAHPSQANNGATKKVVVSVSANGLDSQRVKALLKQKTKELEEKIRILRKREAEYRRIATSREKLREDVEQMEKKVQQFKARNVAMVKQMRTREAEHRTETLELQKREMQTKRKVQQVEFAMKTLEQDLAAREKVSKAQLEAKDREMNVLKDLLFRQREIAKQKEKHREQLAQVRGGTGNAAANGASAANTNSAPALSRQQLHNALSSQIARERQQATLHGRLTLALDHRRNLQRERMLCRSQMRSLRHGSQAYTLAVQRVKNLDKEIKKESQIVVDLQVALAAQKEKERDTLFFVGDREKEKEGSAALISQCGDNVGDLKALVALLWSQHCQEVAETARQTLKLQALQEHEKEEEMHAMDAGARDEMEIDSEAEDQFDDDNQESEESDEDFDPDQTMNASSDEEIDPEDKSSVDKRLSAGSGGKKKDSKSRKPRKSGDSAGGINKKQRESDALMRSVGSINDPDSDNDSVSSSLFGSPSMYNKAAAQKPTKAPRRAAPRGRKIRGLEEIEVSPENVAASSWMKLTVKDLKAELANRQLTVSGVKNDLVKRLIQFELFNSASGGEHQDPVGLEEKPSMENAVAVDDEEPKQTITVAAELSPVNNKENTPAGSTGFKMKSPLFSPLRAPRRSMLSLPLSEMIDLDESTPMKGRTPLAKMNVAEEPKRRLLPVNSGNHFNWAEDGI